MPSSAAWKRSAKRWRKDAHRNRDRFYRQQEALRRVGVSVSLALAVIDKDRGDRTTIFTESTEATGASE
jgi:hypothetical protein